MSSKVPAQPKLLYHSTIHKRNLSHMASTLVNLTGPAVPIKEFLASLNAHEVASTTDLWTRNQILQVCCSQN